MFTPNESSVSRAAFLRSLGLSAATLSAIYFGGCTAKNDVTPAAAATTFTDGRDAPAVFTGNADPGGKVDFSIDLSLPDNAALKTPGRFLSAGLIVVANTVKGNYVALKSVCTHAGGSLWYRASQDDFRCQDHGGLYNNDGSVKMQPPVRPVTVYAVTLSADKKTLRITG